MASSASGSGQRLRVTALLRLLRPKQWLKNSVVLAPLVFANALTDSESVIGALVAALLFCVGSSAAYIVNDWHDIEKDRQHPVKHFKRPLASGEVGKPQALVLLVFLYVILAAGFVVAPAVVAVILAYLLLNVAYTLWLKHQPILDIFTIALGFVLRVYAGAQAITVPMSSWMFVTTLCLALYLAAIKRRQELAGSGSDGREVLKWYSISLIDRYAEMSAIGAILFYSLFVMHARPELVITIPLVLYGLFRYWFVVETMGRGESPTDALFSDWQLLATVGIWSALSVFLLMRA